MPSIDDQVNLPKLLHDLAAAAPSQASAAVGARLRLACRARRMRRLDHHFRIAVAALAASLLLSLGWQWHLSQARALPPVESYSGFLALPYAQSGVPIEQVVVVRINLQPADLVSLGLPPALLTGRNTTHADLLVGQDGIPRAVRLTE